MAQVAVANLFKQCSLRVRNIGAPGWCASDNCNQIASTAVNMGRGVLHWRCGAHEGIVSAVFGPIVTHIDQQEAAI